MSPISSITGVLSALVLATWVSGRLAATMQKTTAMRMMRRTMKELLFLLENSPILERNATLCSTRRRRLYQNWKSGEGRILANIGSGGRFAIGQLSFSADFSWV